MSRKDFQVIARAMASIDDDHARRVASIALADELRYTNPRFDRERFLSACGVTE